MPSGVYFNGDFSIAAWVNPQSTAGSACRIIDCGTTTLTADNVLLTYTTNGLAFYLAVYSNLGQSQLTSASFSQTWTHVATTLTGKSANLYVNGAVAVSSSAFNGPSGVMRTQCYLGLSNWGNPNAYAFFDDVMIFNVGLTQIQVTNVMNYMTTASNSYSTFVSSYGLTNVWNFNGNMKDSYTGSYLSNANSFSYFTDRYGSANGAIYFNSGYAQAPSGVYFSGDFTVAAWVNAQSASQANARLIDFGTSTIGADNVLIGLESSALQMSPYLYVFNNGVYSSVGSPTFLVIGTWAHLAVTLSSTTAKMYINAVLANSATGFLIPRSLSRTICYVGKSYSSIDALAIAYFDDLMIFNKALTQTQLSGVMNTPAY